MSKRSTRFGFDVPDDFPIERLEAVHIKADAIYSANLPIWREWAGGANGALCRFMGAASATGEWTSTYTDRPGINLNVRQDQLLFEFFAAALSSLECLAFGLGAIGEFLRPAAFPGTSKPHTIKFATVSQTFAAAWPGDLLAQRLQAADSSSEMEDLRLTRNILAHRSAPGRTFSETLTSTPADGYATTGPTTWLGQTLSRTTTERPRKWVAETLEEILEAAELFVNREL